LQDEKLQQYFEKADEWGSIGLYYWGTTGIGISQAAVKRLPGNAPLDSSALVFDPKYAQKLGECGLTFLDSAPCAPCPDVSR
jgi:spermidine/putrescine-binding protein